MAERATPLKNDEPTTVTEGLFIGLTIVDCRLAIEKTKNLSQIPSGAKRKRGTLKPVILRPLVSAQDPV